MAQVLAILQRVLAGLSTVLSIVGLIQGQTIKAAQENVPFSIDTNASIIKEVITDPVIGNANIFAALGDIESILAANQLTLLAAIGGPQQTGSPVTLPTTPPTGYGGGGTPHDIWAYVGPGEALTMAQFQSAAGSNATYESTGGILKSSQNWPGWQVAGNWDESQQADPNASFLDAFDVGTILSTDATIQDWINRLYSAVTYSFDAAGHPGARQPTTNWYWSWWMGDLEFEEYKAAKFGGAVATSHGPPVWPFGGDVTWGTLTPLSAAFTIDEDMDGVWVGIDSVPPQTSFFNFDGTPSYRFIGALAFFNTEHDFEFPQNLGFSSSMYCPKALSRADGVSFRVKQGVTGFARPWLNN